MRDHAFGGRNSECVVFGQAVFLASTSSTACYAGYGREHGWSQFEFVRMLRARSERKEALRQVEEVARRSP